VSRAEGHRHGRDPPPPVFWQDERVEQIGSMVMIVAG